MSGTETANHFLDGQESLSELIMLLGHSNLRVRRAAVAALSRWSASETLPVLLSALADQEDATIRNAAADVLLRYGPAVVPGLIRALNPAKERDLTIQLLVILGKIPSREAVDAAIPLASHADPAVAAAAIGCLGAQRDPSSVPTLLDVLSQGQRWQTFYAIDALGEVGHVAAVSRLLPLIEEPYYRKAVLRAMGRIGDESVIPHLVAALVHGKPCPDRTALISLNEMVDRARTGGTRQAVVTRIRNEISNLEHPGLMPGLNKFMAGSDGERKRYAMRALGWFQDPANIPVLVEALADPFVADLAMDGLSGIAATHASGILDAALNVPLPAAAVQKIVTIIGPYTSVTVDEFLRDSLRHEDDDVRQAAAAAIASRVCMDHLESLVEALADTSPLVAKEAVAGLLTLAGQTEERRDEVAGRVEGLTVSSSAEMRCAALSVIAGLGQQNSAEALDLALHDPVAAVRRTAVNLLGQGADPERLWRLTVALADEDARVREEAVRAVGRLRDGRARGVLLAALHDRSIWVRCRAAEALAEHPAVEVQAALEEAAREGAPPVRVSAIGSLGDFWPESRSILQELVEDQDPEIRRAALRAVASGASEIPMDWLVAGLEDVDWTVRCAAADGLGASSLSGGFTPLSLALDRERDSVVRNALMSALFRADSEAALPYLVGALAEKDVAETAAELLVSGFREFADDLRAEWAAAEDPAVREGLAVVLRESTRREGSGQEIERDPS